MVATRGSWARDGAREGPEPCFDDGEIENFGVFMGEAKSGDEIGWQPMTEGDWTAKNGVG